MIFILCSLIIICIVLLIIFVSSTEKEIEEPCCCLDGRENCTHKPYCSHDAFKYCGECRIKYRRDHLSDSSCPWCAEKKQIKEKDEEIKMDTQLEGLQRYMMYGFTYKSYK